MRHPGSTTFRRFVALAAIAATGAGATGAAAGAVDAHKSFENPLALVPKSIVVVTVKAGR